MNAGPTAERVFAGVRALIVGGRLRPGDRLDPAILSAELCSSVTPIREALCVLKGQGLVESRVNGGFHVAAVDEILLADLYGWAGDVLALLLRTTRPAVMVARIAEDLPMDAPARIERIGRAIAAGTGNDEHIRVVATLDARLHPARLVEETVLTDVAAEVALIEASLRDGDVRRSLTLLRHYHSRRRKAAAAIVRALLRGDADNRDIDAV